jgi:hypothetical protein
VPSNQRATFHPKVFLDPAQEAPIATDPRQIAVNHTRRGNHRSNVVLVIDAVAERNENLVGDRGASSQSAIAFCLLASEDLGVVSSCKRCT